MRKHRHWWMLGIWLSVTAAGVLWLVPQMQVARSGGDTARAPRSESFPPELVQEEMDEDVATAESDSASLAAAEDAAAEVPEALSLGVANVESGSASGRGGFGTGSIGGSIEVGGLGAGPGSQEQSGAGRTITQTFNGKAAVKIPTKKLTIKLSPPVTDKISADDPFAAIDRAVNALPLGSIAFNTPEIVSLGDVATIELLASLKETEAELREAIRKAGPVETSSIRLSHKMDARLTGAGFKIEAVTPDVQALSRSEQTRWLWQIEPTKTETLELHLTLSAILKVDGESMTRAVRTFERTIEVEVPLESQVLAFAGEHFEWLVTTIAVPVSGALYYRLRRRRRKPVVESPEETPLSRAA